MKHINKSLVLLSILAPLLSSCFLFSGGENNNQSEQSQASVVNTDGTFLFKGNSVQAINDSISGDLVIPESFNGVTITTIPKNAFKNCIGIKSIKVPKTITTIEKNAFYGCAGLKSIELPFVGNSRTATRLNGEFGFIFSDTEFGGSTEVKAIISKYYIPSSLTHVTITDATFLTDMAFYECSMIEYFNINEEVSSIGEGCFAYCTSFSTISLPNLTKIPDEAFKGCSELRYVDVGEKIKSIGTSAFSGCINLTTFNSETDGFINVPISVNTIEKGAFRQCLTFDSIKLPFCGQNRTENRLNGQFGFIFGDTDYTGAVKVTAIVSCYYIPRNVKEVYIYDASLIGTNAFYECSMIEKLYINSAARNNIGSDAFFDCVTPEWF